jgi:hypothetical protein
MGGVHTISLISVVALLGLCPECRSADFFAQSRPQARIAGRDSAHLPTRTEALPARPDTALPARQDTLTAATRRPSLDLSPPQFKADMNGASNIPFPARPQLGAPRAAANEAPEFHFQGSRVQEMTQRFRREGLPVARLWETHSALLSFGLNQRGKPGLWLIQKTH